jgi:hypothetical protein
MLAIEPGHGGARCELDGRWAPLGGDLLTVRHRRDYGMLVTLAEEEPRPKGSRLNN